jgi:hypothetical protein
MTNVYDRKADFRFQRIKNEGERAAREAIEKVEHDLGPVWAMALALGQVTGLSKYLAESLKRREQ